MKHSALRRTAAIAVAALSAACPAVDRDAPETASTARAATCTALTGARPLVLLEDETHGASSGRLWRELLAAAGLPYTSADVSCVGASIPANVAAVILPDLGTISAGLATTLDAYVSAGGTLLAIRPGSSLAATTGLSAPLGAISNASWISADITDPLAAGLEGSALRLHADALAYALQGAHAIATFSRTPASRGVRPAVAIYDRGSGHSASFAFDPLISIARTRQGNPDWVNMPNNNNSPGYRPDQMFQKNSGTTLIESWNGLDDGTGGYSKNSLPQADEMLALVTALVQRLAEARTPWPRLDAIPGGARSVLVLTADQHANELALTQGLLTTVQNGGGIDSVYFWYPFDQVSTTDASAWRTAGHEIGIHFNYDSLAQTWTAYGGSIDSALSSFAATYPALPPPTVSTRSHNLLWLQTDQSGNPDPLAHARLLASRGIEADTTWSTLSMTYGFMTGSGLPMRFLDLAAGSTINVYQLATQYQDNALMADYANTSSLYNYSLRWDGQRFKHELVRALEDATLRSRTGITALIHTNTFGYPGTPFDYYLWEQPDLSFILSAQAAAGGVTWNAERWLRFHQARAAATVDLTQAFAGTSLRLHVVHSAPAPLALVIPASVRRPISALIDNAPATLTLSRVRGELGALISLPAGDHQVQVDFQATPTDSRKSEQWYSCGNTGELMSTGDFDGDGRLDVDCRNPTTGNHRVALSRKRGGWGGASSWLSSWCSNASAPFGTADFDGDGRDDLYCNLSGQTYVAATSLAIAPSPAGGPAWLTGWCSQSGAAYGTGDFDGDGLSDVYCHTGAAAYVALSNGSTQLLPAPNGTTAWLSSWCPEADRRIHAADYDGDGRDDLLCFTGGTARVALAREGSFVATPGLTTPWISGFCTATGATTTAGDFDGDGKADLLCSDAGTIRVALSNGTGAFTAATSPWLTSFCAAAPASVRAADFDGDGKLDLLCASSGTLSVARSTGTAFALSPSGGTAWLTGFCTASGAKLGARDLSGDGRADVWCDSGGAISIAIADGYEHFVLDGGSRPASWCASAGAQVGAGDFDGDGLGELFCLDAGATTVARGTLYFRPVPSGTTPWLSGWCSPAGSQFGAGDFDGDGKSDVWCKLPSGPGIYVARSSGTALIPTPSGSTPWTSSFCAGGGTLGIGDFDGDGRDDLYCASAGSVTVARSDGQTFAPFPTGGAPWIGGYCSGGQDKLTVADADGDGKSDLICRSGSDVSFARSNGTNQFIPGTAPLLASWCPASPASLRGHSSARGRNNLGCTWQNADADRATIYATPLATGPRRPRVASTVTTTAVGPTICAHSFERSASGWRTWTWRPEDCTNGLPRAGAIGVGQGENGAGTAGQLSCTLTGGGHYNHPSYAGATTGTVRCFYADPADPDITTCSYSFTDYVTGWRTRTWQTGDCTAGRLPGSDWISLGMGQNGSGTGGQVDCSATSGGHYNNPSVAGATNGIVTCAYVRPTHARVRSCTANFPGYATGWRTQTWSAAYCPQGLPPDHFEPIGWGINGSGTAGQVSCTTASGSHYNHPSIAGATNGWVRCLYVQPGPQSVLPNAVMTTAGPLSLSPIAGGTERAGFRMSSGVLSGYDRTGTLLWSTSTGLPDQVPGGGFDFDGDGWPDVALSETSAGTGSCGPYAMQKSRLRLYSGRTGTQYLPIAWLDDFCFANSYPVNNYTGDSLLFGALPSTLFVSPTYATTSWYFQFSGGAFSTLGSLYYPSTSSYDSGYTADLPNLYPTGTSYIQYSQLANGLITETEDGNRLLFFTSARAVSYQVAAYSTAQLALDHPFLNGGRTDVAGRNYGLVSAEPRAPSTVVIVAGTGAITLLNDQLTNTETDPWGGIERHVTLWDATTNAFSHNFYSYAHDNNDGNKYEGRVAFPARALIPVAGAFRSRIAYTVYKASTGRWTLHVSQPGSTADAWTYDQVYLWDVADIDGDGRVELITSPTTGYNAQWRTDVQRLDAATGALVPLASYTGYLPKLQASLREPRRSTSAVYLYPVLVTEDSGGRRVLLIDSSQTVSALPYP